MTLISNISVFQGVYPVQLNPPTSQQLCLLCRTSWRLNSRNQLPIRNVGRTCNGSGNVWNWESRSRCMGTLENTAPHKIHCDNFFFKFCSVEMLCVQFASKPPREMQMSCENQHIKAFGLLTWEFAFPISEIAIQMRLITWQNLTSKVKPK